MNHQSLRIVLATSTNTADDPIAHLPEKHHQVVRGDEQDVLSRFILTLQTHPADHVVRLTADNPFYDTQLISEVIREHIAHNADYTATTGLPLGMNYEIISAEALRRTHHEATDPADREHVTSYIIRSPHFKKHTVKFNFDFPEGLRLTVDYPSDYALACEIALAQQQAGRLFNLPDILELIRQRPWLPLINKDNWQVKDYASLAEELPDALDILKKFGFPRTRHFLQNNAPR